MQQIAIIRLGVKGFQSYSNLKGRMEGKGKRERAERERESDGGGGRGKVMWQKWTNGES